MTETTTLTTDLAVEAVAWERAPRHIGRSVNQRIVCADGFAVSVQASTRHYANDSSDTAPYWKPDSEAGREPPVAYPFTTFEVGNPSTDPDPAEVWDEYESGGVWAWVPRQVVADLLALHGGAVEWESADASRAKGPFVMETRHCDGCSDLYARGRS